MSMLYDKEPVVRVGIITAPTIQAEYFNSPVPGFTLKDVVIGKGFHWERKEDQKFIGSLKIQNHDDGKMTAVNVVGIEDYLKSVISSEMNATSNIELLKAHSVISRSWLLAQIHRDKRYDGINEDSAVDRIEADEMIIRWYDREDHSDFDVCADDHCQRYQGVTRQTSEAVAKAVTATRGELMTVEGRICDARFSKCCGGITESFENCWEPRSHSYLTALRDTKRHGNLGIPDLTFESRARSWITAEPDAFCNTRDKALISQILNGYDREDPDFYRWKVVYRPTELDDIVRERSGIDLGEITEIVPLRRGPSGRIFLLRIAGTEGTVTIGKELEIRKWLSRSHLKSSAFVIDRDNDGNWVFTGAGWGHGVGLCQIGAAVMASQGYGYREILAHYFPGAIIEKGYL